MTPTQALRDRGRSDPDRIALIAGERRWTCRALVDEADRYLAAFRARGVRRGDRVAIQAFNVPEAVFAFVACWSGGIILVPAGNRETEHDLEKLFDRVRPSLFLVQSGLVGARADLAPDLLSADARFAIGQAGDDRLRPWRVEVPDGQDATDLPEPGPDDVAMLLGSSGTTGRSKLTVWAQRTLAALAVGTEARGFTPDAVHIVCEPMMHVSGTFSLASCLLSGAVAVLVEQFDADAVLDAVERHRCTLLKGLPFMFAELSRAQTARPRDVGSVRDCLTAGDLCPPQTIDAFAEAFDRPLLSFWAATEEVSAWLPGEAPGPVSRFLPGTHVELRDEEGRAVPDGEAGELFVRSPGTVLGYWQAPGTIDPLEHGLFRSGDLMCRQPDGQYRYLGRTKDIIIRDGYKISPAEVEEVLRRQDGIADAAVAGIPDDVSGERVGAVVVVAEGAGPSTVDTAMEGVRRELADYKVPQKTIEVDAVPRNALTKIDRAAVARLLSGA